MMGTWQKIKLENVISSGNVFSATQQKWIRKIAMFVQTIVMYLVIIWVALHVYERVGFEKAVIIYIVVLIMVTRQAFWSMKDALDKRIFETAIDKHYVDVSKVHDTVGDSDIDWIDYSKKK